jgi:hypothetical protein
MAHEGAEHFFSLALCYGSCSADSSFSLEHFFSLAQRMSTYYIRVQLDYGCAKVILVSDDTTLATLTKKTRSVFSIINGSPVYFTCVNGKGITLIENDEMLGYARPCKDDPKTVLRISTTATDVAPGRTSLAAEFSRRLTALGAGAPYATQADGKQVKRNPKPRKSAKESAAFGSKEAPAAPFSTG